MGLKEGVLNVTKWIGSRNSFIISGLLFASSIIIVSLLHCNQYLAGLRGDPAATFLVTGGLIIGILILFFGYCTLRALFDTESRFGPAYISTYFFICTLSPFYFVENNNLCLLIGQ